jgi:hypothetical protein
MRHIVKEYAEHFNTERPHQAMDNQPLCDDREPHAIQFPIGEVACQEQLRGPLKSYDRKAT